MTASPPPRAQPALAPSPDDDCLVAARPIAGGRKGAGGGGDRRVRGRCSFRAQSGGAPAAGGPTCPQVRGGDRPDHGPGRGRRAPAPAQPGQQLPGRPSRGRCERSGARGAPGRPRTARAGGAPGCRPSDRPRRPAPPRRCPGPGWPGVPPGCAVGSVTRGPAAGGRAEIGQAVGYARRTGARAYATTSWWSTSWSALTTWPARSPAAPVPPAPARCRSSGSPAATRTTTPSGSSRRCAPTPTSGVACSYRSAARASTGPALKEAVRQSGRWVESLVIQHEGGTVKTVDRGRALVEEGLRKIAAVEPRAHVRGDLVVGTICGGSDSTSTLTANPAVGRSFDWLVAEGAVHLRGDR